MSKFRVLQSHKTPDQFTGPAGTNWAYWAMHEGTGSALSNDSRSNVTLDDVTLAGTGGTEWNNAGWLTGDATDLNGALTYATDNDLASICDFNGKSALIGFQILGTASAARVAMLHIGGNVTTTEYGLWIAQEATATNDRLIYRMRDNAGTASTLAYSNGSLAVDGSTVWNIIVTIDNDAGELKLDGTDAAAPLTEFQGTAADISGLGDITFATQSGTPALRIMDDGTSTARDYNGQMRRLLIVNYGTAGLPTNISDIKQSLYKSGMIPTWKLQG